MPARSSAEIEKEIRDRLEGAIAREGSDLVAVNVLQVGGRVTLRLSIDRATGVDVESCVRVSRLVSPLLDAEDPFDCPWDLEVSSPGLERPVQRLEDFRRFIGRRIRVRVPTAGGRHPRRRFTGLLADVRGETVVLEAEDGRHDIPWADIEKANLIPDFNTPTSSPGGEPVDPDTE
jgi:ribosome maturation factor RimP